MTPTGTSPAAPAARRKQRPWLLALAALAAAVLVTAGAVVAVRRPAAVPVPAVELTDPDPAVAAAYRAARDAVGAAPRSATAWGQFGMFLLDYNCYPETRTCLAQAERLDPLEPRWPYYHALTLTSDDPPQAVAYLERTVALCGDTPDAPRLRLADLLLECGRLDEAERQLRQALAANPGSARALFGLGRVAAERGDARAGVEFLRRAAADRHTERNARALLAQLLRRLGDERGAEAERRRAEVGTEPLSWPDPYLEELHRLRVGRQAGIDRTNELLAAGRADEARAAAEGVVHDYPDAGSGWLLLGQSCIRQQDLRSAGQALRRAVELMPDSVEAHYELGTVLLLQEDPAGAAAHFRRAVEVKPGSAAAWFDLGHCLSQLGDDGGAVEALRKAVDCRPQFAEAHRDLGKLLARRGRAARRSSSCALPWTWTRKTRPPGGPSRRRCPGPPSAGSSAKP